MGRDHSYECEVCGEYRGGFSDFLCLCDQPLAEMQARLYTLAYNLEVGAALCRAFRLGVVFNAWSTSIDGDVFEPGCGKAAP